MEISQRKGNSKKQSSTDFAHHATRRERFREEETQAMQQRFGTRRDTFGQRTDFKPKRKGLAGVFGLRRKKGSKEGQL